MMIGPTDFPDANKVRLGPALVTYDVTNRALVPTIELGEWLKANARGAWCVDFDENKKAIIRFVDDRDPILFKLWWSEYES